MSVPGSVSRGHMLVGPKAEGAFLDGGMPLFCGRSRLGFLKAEKPNFHSALT